MESSLASRRGYYRPELDALRFVAFLLVFLYHSLPSVSDSRVFSALGTLTPFFYGSVMACRFGLSLFFTLSAFLICELLTRERQATGSIAIRQFYIRRILRIWPLYYLGVGIGIVAAMLPGNHSGELSQMGWFALFMGAGFNIAFGATSPMGQLWSISVEEQFYLFAPWVLRFFSRSWLFGFSLALVVAANLYLFHAGQKLLNTNLVWTNSLVQFECFAVGILLSLTLRGRTLALAIWHRMALLLAGWTCWFCAGFGMHFDFSSENPGSWTLMAGYALSALGSALLLVGVLGISSSLVPGWLRYLGRISYGLYVFHLLAMLITKSFLIGPVSSITNPLFFLKGVTTLLLTFIMAAVSYRYFERPFLKKKEKLSIIESKPPEPHTEADRREEMLPVPEEAL